MRSETRQTRRRMLGVAGAAFSTMLVAGCGEPEEGDDDVQPEGEDDDPEAEEGTGNGQDIEDENDDGQDTDDE